MRDACFPLLLFLNFLATLPPKIFQNGAQIRCHFSEIALLHVISFLMFMFLYNLGLKNGTFEKKSHRIIVVSRNWVGANLGAISEKYEVMVSIQPLYKVVSTLHVFPTKNCNLLY